MRCAAPRADGGYCTRQAREACTAVAFPAGGGRLDCGAPLCGRAQCRRAHATTSHGQASEERVEDWRRYQRHRQEIGH
ncbi:MAG: hypothetical protein M0R73_02600 [Dehalococcoidia bacterium]|nr:hypothetical protein [Dehalococcoidia bacterium]